MRKESITSLCIVAIALFLLQNYGSSKVSVREGGFTHSGIYFDKHFPLTTNRALLMSAQRQIVDECTTAKGYYKKSHHLFNTSIEYYNGCKPKVNPTKQSIS